MSVSVSLHFIDESGASLDRHGNFGCMNGGVLLDADEQDLVISWGSR